MLALRSIRLRSYAFQKALPRTQICRSIARRGFASVASKTPKSGGDAVWAAGSIAITIPSCWYLLSNRTDQRAQHAHHDDDHEIPDHIARESNTEELEASADEVNEGDGVEYERDNNLEDSEQQYSANDITSQNKSGLEILNGQPTIDCEGDCKEIEDKGVTSEHAEDLDIKSEDREGAMNPNTSHPIDSSDNSEATTGSQGNANTSQMGDKADLKSS